MGLELTEEEVQGILGRIDGIYAILGNAQGRADSYAARRNDFKIIQFPQIKQPDADTAPGITKEVISRENGKKERRSEYKSFFKKYKQEFLKMTDKLQKKIMRAVERKPRLHKGSYEKRALINGIEIYACSTKLDECEATFFRELAVKVMGVSPTEPEPTKRKQNVASVTFAVWADDWFEQVYKPNVTPMTFINESYRYKNHIRPYFGEMPIKEILPIDCIKFCNGLIERGEARTAESCYGLVKRILQFAVDSDLIPKNPMSAVKPIKAERTNGVPLSKDEEMKLLASVKGTWHEAIIVLALYTGLRPCEYSTARIEGEFIVAQNRKQRNVKKVVFKKIPITPMLAPYLPIIQEKMNDWENAVKGAQKAFKSILPNHKPYDLRTTFATRSQECGVPETVVQEWLGHKAKTLLGQVYTKFSDDYLLLEGKKVKY